MFSRLAKLTSLTTFKVVLAMSVCTLSTLPVTANAQELGKLDKLKAAYMFNFSKYISWPENAFNSPNEPVVLCVSASDEFTIFTRELVKGRKIGSQKRELQVVDDTAGATCHIRFISSVTHTVKPFSANTLIISSDANLDIPNSAIAFFRDGAKLRFEVNLSQVQKLNLNISSELLKLARIK